jgi:hypothetical protein
VQIQTARVKRGPYDLQRPVRRSLFARVYDRTVMERFAATKSRGWWVINVDSNKNRVVTSTKCEEVTPRGPRVCICHDIERGLGRSGIDEERMRTADRIEPEVLAEMIRCEKTADIRALPRLSFVRPRDTQVLALYPILLGNQAMVG